jgi:hypothetical protein
MNIDFPTFLGIVSVSILCIFATSVMIFENDFYPIEVADSSSTSKIEKYASTLSAINQQGIVHQDNGDSEQFTQQMKLMQQKQKEIASKILGLNIQDAYVAEGWNFPFMESSKVTMHIPEFKKPLCDIPEKIPLHLQMISQSEMFQMFAEKYFQHDLTLDISDERNHRGWIHYNLGATSDDGLFSTYTHFHFDSCTNEMHGAYFLLCQDIKNDEHVSTSIKSEITSSLENKEFCNIELESWHQDLRTYHTKISTKLEKYTQKVIPYSKENQPTMSHLEFKRLGLLLDITRHYDSGILEPEKLQEDLKEYERVFGNLPDELLKLLEEKNAN